MFSQRNSAFVNEMNENCQVDRKIKTFHFDINILFYICIIVFGFSSKKDDGWSISDLLDDKNLFLSVLMAYILILQLTLGIILRDHVTHNITWTNIWYGLKLRNWLHHGICQFGYLIADVLLNLK